MSDFAPARAIFANDLVNVSRCDWLELYHVFIVGQKPKSFIRAAEAESHIKQKSGYVVNLTPLVKHKIAYQKGQNDGDG